MYISYFFWPMQKMPEMGPGLCFPTNPDLADILGDTDLDFENFHCLEVLDPRFLEIWNQEIWKFGIPKNPENKSSQNQNLCRQKCRQGLD